jgi:hypothetical protein
MSNILGAFSLYIIEVLSESEDLICGSPKPPTEVVTGTHLGYYFKYPRPISYLSAHRNPPRGPP